MKEELLETAGRQHGLLTLSQLRMAGELRRAERRLASGEWVEQQPGVVHPAVLQTSFAARVTAVRLAMTGAALGSWCFSHRTAAALLKLGVPDSERLDVLLPMTRRKLALQDVQLRYTEKRIRVMRVQDDPVPFVPQTLLQCAVVLSRDDLLHAIEGAVRADRTDLQRLRDVCSRGASGAAALRSAVEELSAEGLDRWVRRFVRLLVRAGLPQPATEVPVSDGGRVRAYLDGYWDEVKLALEVDDWETHGDRASQERDRQRDRWLLTTYGIVTVRVTPREIRDRPAKTVSDVVQAFHQRRDGSTAPMVGLTSSNDNVRHS